MSRTSAPRPTDAELAILRVLWERGPSTVRQVHDLLALERPAAYTTALKLLQIMAEKGLVDRDERDRTHIYRARLSQETTQRQLVMQALATKRASAEELKDIRDAIDEARNEREVRRDDDARD